MGYGGEGKRDIYTYKQNALQLKMDRNDTGPKPLGAETTHLSGRIDQLSLFLSILHSVMSDRDDRCGCGTLVT